MYSSDLKKSLVLPTISGLCTSHVMIKVVEYSFKILFELKICAKILRLSEIYNGVARRVLVDSLYSFIV